MNVSIINTFANIALSKCTIYQLLIYLIQYLIQVFPFIIKLKIFVYFPAGL